MSFEKRRRVVLSFPWRRGCAVPLCNPVVFHWGLNCLGDIFGCPSWGGRCAAAPPERGLRCWMNVLQCTGCPQPGGLAGRSAGLAEEPRCRWGAWEELLAVCSPAGEGEEGWWGWQNKVWHKEVLSPLHALQFWCSDRGPAPRIWPCHCCAGNLTSWTWPTPCVCVHVEVYTYVYIYLQIIYMLYWINAYYKTN